MAAVTYLHNPVVHSMLSWQYAPYGLNPIIRHKGDIRILRCRICDDWRSDRTSDVTNGAEDT